MKTLYSARASAHGGRQGHVEFPDGVLKLDLSMPEAMGGSGTNPEQLFAAGYSGYFENALCAWATEKELSGRLGHGRRWHRSRRQRLRPRGRADRGPLGNIEVTLSVAG
jgi:hypothetical protein